MERLDKQEKEIMQEIWENRIDEETPSARSIHSDVSRLGGVSVIRFR